MKTNNDKKFKYKCNCSEYNFTAEKHYKSYLFFYENKKSLYICDKCKMPLVYLRKTNK